MEAVSRGAAEAGGHVIGVTCDEVERWRKVKANAWVREERHFQTLEQRLIELVRACDAAIALPGGPGTLTEIGLTWNLMIVDSMPRKPLVLVGAGWRAVFEEMFRSLGEVTPASQRELLLFTPDIESAVTLIEKR
jgi:predicted Rossmann-fold nucleotide-binding protein